MNNRRNIYIDKETDEEIVNFIEEKYPDKSFSWFARESMKQKIKRES